jgi:hypothetical protein
VLKFLKYSSTILDVNGTGECFGEAMKMSTFYTPIPSYSPHGRDRQAYSSPCVLPYMRASGMLGPE